MQIKFLSLATLAVLFAAVSAAPGGGAQSSSGVSGSGDEAAFNARVQAIQNDPEVKNTLEFLIQQIAGKLNEGAPSPSTPSGGQTNDNEPFIFGTV